MSARSLAVLVAAALAGCASGPSPAAEKVHGGAQGARARLRDPAGKEVGVATFQPVEGGVKLEVKASGLPPGKHGFHVHAAGRCDAPDFKTAGPHYNPTGKQHGHDNPQGAHAGDLPNLEVGSDGSGKASFVARGLSLGQGEGTLFPSGGTSIVLHADADDGKSDPAGNSGARIACGVVERG